MLAVLSQCAFIAAALVAPEVLVDLRGAHLIACSASRTSAGETCFTAAASTPIVLDVQSPHGRPDIHAIKYGIFQADRQAAIASGQQIDGKGVSVISTPLPLPLPKEGSGKAAGCGDGQEPAEAAVSYIIEAEIDIGSAVLSRKLALEILPINKNPTSAWPIEGAQLEIAPKGHWRSRQAHAVMPAALDIESCTTPGARIVAFVVQPLPGVSLTQYVTNSIEAYSDVAMWHVGKREPSRVAFAEGEHLSLEQMIAGESVPIEKYFLHADTRILILSIYGQQDSAAPDAATWIRTRRSVR
ncbi:MAG: hypothetical protein ABIO49_13405 [Dokdonella sp.]